MKYMILTYASQQDYDGMSGKDTGKPAWTAEDFAAMGAFMEKFNADLAESGDRGADGGHRAARVEHHPDLVLPRDDGGLLGHLKGTATWDDGYRSAGRP